MPDRIVDRINVGGEEYHLEPVIDASPVQGSAHAVSSGGVWQVLQDHDIFENPVLFNKVFGRDIPKFFNYHAQLDIASVPIAATRYGYGKFLFFNNLYIVYGGTCGIHYYSPGSSWTASSSFAINTVITDVIEAEGALWAITSDDTYKGLWRSTDGMSWSKIPSLNLKITSIYYAANAIDGNAFIVGTESGIYRSTDSCATFTSVGGPNNALQIGRTNHGGYILFAGTNSNGLWRSGNSGNTWVQVSSIPSTASVPSIPVYGDNISVHHLCVGTDSGIYYATSVDSTNFTLTSVTISMRKVVYDGNIYIAADSSGNNGLYWSFDAIEWNKSSDFSTASVVTAQPSIVHKNGVWVAIVKLDGVSHYDVILSNNGINWFYAVIRPYNNIGDLDSSAGVSYVNGEWMFVASKVTGYGTTTKSVFIRIYRANANILRSTGFFGD